MNYYSRQYVSTQVNTASNKRIIVYLYDSAISHIDEAAQALQSGSDSTCGRHLGVALDIVIELASGLDYEAFPELAGRLDAIYNFLIEKLALAQRERNPKELRACQKVLGTLVDAWRHVTRDAPPPKTRKARENESKTASFALAV